MKYVGGFSPERGGGVLGVGRGQSAWTKAMSAPNVHSSVGLERVSAAGVVVGQHGGQ